MRTEGQPTEQEFVRPPETTTIDGVEYKIDDLRQFVEGIPTEDIDLEALSEVVKSGNHYWKSADGASFGPGELLADWKTAEENPDFAEHVDGIKRANLDDPIWVKMPQGYVVDGIHRLTKAFQQGQKTIKVKKIWDLPKRV